MCACVPPPPHQIVRRPPKARVKTLAEAWIPKENMFYAVGARVMDVSMVIEAWGGGGWSVCAPLPPRRIARRSRKRA
jgi:hypothetical protein